MTSKALLVIAVVFTLSGCDSSRSTVEDNTLERRELEEMFEICLGTYATQITDRLPFYQRYLCMSAVMQGR